MITMNGEINVRTIDGRYGPFNVGTLKTDIGEFAIKDKVLEELSEGSYEARCVIDQIRPNGFLMGNRFAVELLASLYDVDLLQDEADASASQAIVEIDPVEEELTEQPGSREPGEQADVPAEAMLGDKKLGDEQCDARELFGHLWPCGDSVQLDPTIDRVSLRAQIHYLKQQGYQYQASSKAWFLSSDSCSQYR